MDTILKEGLIRNTAGHLILHAKITLEATLFQTEIVTIAYIYFLTISPPVVILGHCSGGRLDEEYNILD